MSFQVEREYGRHILKPICAPSQEENNALATVLKTPTTSPAWAATTHTFCGTGARYEPTFWPPSRFNENPAKIPNNDKFDTRYKPESGEVTASGDGLYRMYDSLNRSTATETNSVPRPTIVAKRYIPTGQDSLNVQGGSVGVTLLMLPGMGLLKEIFEPMMEVLLLQLRSKKVRVEEIWSVDMPLCGETALVNPVGYAYGNEKDITRDLLMFITGYLPVQPHQHLPESLLFRAPGLHGVQPTRPNLHVVAHSLGAQAAILSAVHAPDIFSSLSVMDPAFIPGGKIVEAFAKLPKELFCTQLKEQYPSRNDLAAALKTNKHTRGWDARVSALFVERGVAEAGDGTFRLVAQPRLEWALYYDKETPTHCYDRLKDLRTPFNAIMPTKPFAVPPKMFEADVSTMKQTTRITWVPGTTHQIPFERVDQCAKLVAEWLHDCYNTRSQTARL